MGVKMAACLHQDGDSSESDKVSLSSHSQNSRQATGGTQGGVTASSATIADIKLEGDKAYDKVAQLDVDQLKNLLDEVSSNSKDKSPTALALLRKEEDAIREESSSGDDAGVP